MGRERRLGRGKAGEEQLRGGCAADAGLPGQPDAVRPEAVARDPVDEDRIEVVDGGIAVAVEGSRADLGQGSGDLGQRLLHGRVECRAPEGVPGAVRVLEVGMHEALGDAAAGELDDREGRPRAAAELEPVGRRVREPDELRRVDPPLVGP